MEPTEQITYILPTLSAMVDRIGPTQLNKSTPCSVFTVHDVLDHMIVLGGSFAYSFRGNNPRRYERPLSTAGYRPSSSGRRWTTCSTPSSPPARWNALSPRTRR